MWNNINQPLRDPGLEGARRYLVAKGAVRNERCVFHSGSFRELERSQAPYKLYVVAHGCSDRPAMASGEWFDGGRQRAERFWAASKLARELVLRGLPGNRTARIRLCLCHSAQVFDAGVFAQQLAQELHKQGTPPRIDGFGHGPHTFADVYVGGFPVPVHWAAGSKVNQNVPDESASRIYFRADAAGTRIDDKRGMPGKDAAAQVWCYFPFNYLEDPFARR